MSLLIKIPNYPPWLCIHEYSYEGGFKIITWLNEDSALMSPKCPWKRVLASGRQPSGWPCCSKRSLLLRWEPKKMKGAWVWPKSFSSLTFCIFKDEREHDKTFPMRMQISPHQAVFSAHSYCHCFRKLCECRLWLDVLENSHGEEPFISQASAITGACSHRQNHLLEFVENGSPKRYGPGVHHSIPGNLHRCHSNKILSLSSLSPWV